MYSATLTLVQTKQLYWVQFERNSVRIKDLHHDYVQVCVNLLYKLITTSILCVFRNTIQYFLLQTVLKGAELPHDFIYMDEAAFSLARTRHQDRVIVGQRAVVNVPGQRNFTLFAAISVQRVLHQQASLGPSNTGHCISKCTACRPEQSRIVS